MLEFAGSEELLADQLSDLANVLLPWPLDEFMAKQGVVPSRSADRRRFARIYYRHRAMLRLSQTLPAFPRATEMVLAFSCDVSRSGVCFLSDRELYPREVVEVSILRLGKRQLQVMRCRRLSDRCYEVGASFALADGANDNGAI